MLHLGQRLATVGVTVAVLVSGCGGNAEKPATSSERPAATTADDGAAPSRAASRSPEAYQGALTTAAEGLRAILRDLRRARTVAGLDSRLFRAEEELDAWAAWLERVSPPVEVEAEHERLVGGLYDLASAAGDAYTAPELCGAPSVMARLSRGKAAAELRAGARRLAAAGYRVRGFAPPRQQTPNRRLANGAVLRRAGAGTGRFSVDNGTDRDAVVKLVRGGNRIVVALYVRRRAQATVAGIPSGSHRIRFAQGDDWDSDRRAFTRNCEFTKFDRRANFTGSVAITVTLHEVVGGTASTRPISPSEF